MGTLAQTSPPNSTQKREAFFKARRCELSRALVNSGEYFLCERSHHVSGLRGNERWSNVENPLAKNALAGEHRSILVTGFDDCIHSTVSVEHVSFAPACTPAYIALQKSLLRNFQISTQEFP